MIIILSPAKSMNFDNPAPTETFTTPALLSQSRKLVRILKKFNKSQLMELMSVSESIADLNVARFKTFKPPFDLENAKQALFAFTGDVYRHMRMNTYDKTSLDFAQSNLRILSGLYGYLRPLDLIQPYRLEMKTRLENDRGSSLYKFWGERITGALNKDLKEDAASALINLASKEYSRVVNFKKIKAQVITVDFKEIDKGEAKTIAIFAKWARGMMADYIIQNRLSDPADIRAFDLADYKFSEEDSSVSNWIFKRPRPE